MRHRKLIIVYVLLFISALRLSGSCKEDHGASEELSEEQAYSRAINYLGIEIPIEAAKDTLYPSTDITLIKYTNIGVIYPKDNRVEIEAWQVRVSKVDFRHKESIERGVADNYRKDLLIIIDSHTGALLEIHTDPIPNMAHVKGEASQENIEEILYSQYGSIEGLPDSVPNYGLLPVTFSAVGCRCYDAKETIAYLADYSKHGKKPIPAWIIITRGLSGDEFFNNRHGVAKDLSDKVYSYFCIVNTETGKWMTMTGL